VVNQLRYVRKDLLEVHALLSFHSHQNNTGNIPSTRGQSTCIITQYK